MPTLKSSKKRLRQNIKRRAANKAVKSKARTVVKTALERGQADAPETLAAAYSAIDRAAKRGVIHTKQADRKKARLTARLKKAVAPENK